MHSHILVFSHLCMKKHEQNRNETQKCFAWDGYSYNFVVMTLIAHFENRTGVIMRYCSQWLRIQLCQVGDTNTKKQRLYDRSSPGFWTESQHTIIKTVFFSNGTAVRYETRKNIESIALQDTLPTHPESKMCFWLSPKSLMEPGMVWTWELNSSARAEYTFNCKLSRNSKLLFCLLKTLQLIVHRSRRQFGLLSRVYYTSEWIIGLGSLLLTQQR